MDLDGYRKASHDTWEEMAAGWSRQRRWMWEATRSVSDWLIGQLDPRPGQTILELAAGTGETGLVAARAVGDGGRLISTDFAEGMVEATRAEADRLGLPNVETRRMDAEAMDLPDDSVDAVVCRWGYMLMGNPAQALAETRRVLREPGRLALSVWGTPESNPWAAVPGRTLIEQTGAPPPDRTAPGIFALADERRLCVLLSDAGFGEQQFADVDVLWRFEGFDDFWRFVTELAGGLARAIRELSEAEQRSYRERLEGAMAAHVDGPGYVLHGRTLNASAA